MKPPPFDYYAPATLDEALVLLEEHGDDGRVLAGGQSLVPLLALRLARPSVLVDVNGVSGLDTIAAVDGAVTVGTMVRERAAERSDVIARCAPLLAEALPFIGHEAIRTRGTIGGSLAHADPAGELPAVALALGGEIVARSRARGTRTIPAAEFFAGYFTTALEPDEMLVELRLPVLAPGTAVSFQEASRRHGDFAMVGVGVSLTIDDGTVRDARIALFAVADVPVRASNAEAMLVGARPDAAVLAEAANLATRDLSPASDLHASAAYRRHVGATLVRRALEEAARRTGAQR